MLTFLYLRAIGATRRHATDDAQAVDVTAGFCRNFLWHQWLLSFAVIVMAVERKPSQPVFHTFRACSAVDGKKALHFGRRCIV
ncbi:hypothetical protein BaRGS_00004338 [Batillaria attramentaria]|uniref:Secreted protein n=1 Tax=Batillaria attramentaria TaxID=370345 RepID=A0ABD0LYF5_9CAEN